MAQPIDRSAVSLGPNRDRYDWDNLNKAGEVEHVLEYNTGNKLGLSWLIYKIKFPHFD